MAVLFIMGISLVSCSLAILINAGFITVHKQDSISAELTISGVYMLMGILLLTVMAYIDATN